ncbi:MAG: tetraacyldisaccharide 4'-kinase [Planctomycetales bacterium]|nr:tetraacyldisaccharide 4'-kinase [Planctomycetales bacterium]
MNPSHFRDLVSGRRRGVGASLLRTVLRAGSVPYGWAVRRRNRQFDRGAREVARPEVPVISIGNLTVGGTGKTPLVEWFARQLRSRGVRVTILSRGYRAGADGRNDEALELELSLPDVPHLQNADRAASAQVAVEELAAQMLLLDDGFQHRQLARDFDVALLDASEPFGFDRLLPAGTLREPVSGLRRAQAVILSRADMLSEPQRSAIRRRVEKLAPDALWGEVQHRAAALLDADGGRTPLAKLAGQRVVAFCGIGNPAGFRHTLAALGCEVAELREFPDHHDYPRADVDALATWAQESGAQRILCTRKDLVKLRTPALGGVPLAAVAIEIDWLSGQNELKAAIDRLAEDALQNDVLADWAEDAEELGA